MFVNSGKEKGKRGVVKEVRRNKNAVIVEGLNLVKKHVKSTPEHKGTRRREGRERRER